MPKTHENLILEAENELLKSMVLWDEKTVLKYINPEIVYLNDCGNVFYGFENMHENNRFFTTFESIEVIERTITVFTNVAVVTTLEARAGHYFDVAFAQNYRISRIWKLHTTGWKVIAATAVAI